MSTKTEIGEEEDVDISDLLNQRIVVFNDNVNSFDNVITAFVEILHHTEEQAEQCAWIIHTKGKCSVKEGKFEELKPFRDAICERGIDARIQ